MQVRRFAQSNRPDRRAMCSSGKVRVTTENAVAVACRADRELSPARSSRRTARSMTGRLRHGRFIRSAVREAKAARMLGATIRSSRSSTFGNAIPRIRGLQSNWTPQASTFRIDVNTHTQTIPNVKQDVANMPPCGDCADVCRRYLPILRPAIPRRPAPHG